MLSPCECQFLLTANHLNWDSRISFVGGLCRPCCQGPSAKPPSYIQCDVPSRVTSLTGHTAVSAWDFEPCLSRVQRVLGKASWPAMFGRPTASSSAQRPRRGSAQHRGASPWDPELARASCPAARALSYHFAATAGKIGFSFPHASRVSLATGLPTPAWSGSPRGRL